MRIDRAQGANTWIYVTETIADRTVGCDRDDQNKLFISYDSLLE